MQKYSLELFFKIIGIGSASGLLFHNDLLFLISDNSSYLYEYNWKAKQLTKIALNDHPGENIAKKVKPDYESMALKGREIIILGSGSTENRNIITTYHLKSKKVISKDFTATYEQFKSIASFSDKELNIEGCILTKAKSYYFQRGNAATASNGVFCVDNKTEAINFKAITLPKINDIEASFTDAILVDDKIYFLACVENTKSTYDDGEILGTFLGVVSLNNLIVENTIVISEKLKFEGITLYKKSATTLEFLLCEDNDTELLKSTLYKLKIKL